MNEIGHVVLLLIWHEATHGWIQKVYTGVDELPHRRFFRDAFDENTVALDHAVRNVELILPHGDRQISLVLTMKIEHLTEVNARENVAVNYQQRIFGVFEQAQRADSSERLILFYVSDLNSEVLPVLEVFRDDLAFVVSGDVQASNARLLETFDDQFQQRAAANRQHRFRQRVGQRPQTCAQSACHHDCAYRQFKLFNEIAKQCDIYDATVFVDQRNLPHSTFIHQEEQRAV